MILLEARLQLKLLTWLLILFQGINSGIGKAAQELREAYLRPNSGYITIDCGSAVAYNATFEYEPDATFIDTGTNWPISSQYMIDGLYTTYRTVRSFPEGDRNCYTLKPSGGRNNNYLIRATFMYGNYDGKNNIPIFHIYIGVNFWSEVDLSNIDTRNFNEIMYKPSSDYINVCLVNIGQGTPFISELSLRPVNRSVYNPDSGAALFTSRRYITGSISNTDEYSYQSYQGDVYDRYWSPLPSGFLPYWSVFNSSREIKIQGNDAYKLPSDFFKIGARPEPGQTSIIFNHQPEAGTQEFYIYWHFAETQKLSKDDVREFNIFMNGNVQIGPIRPKYLNPLTVASRPVSLGFGDTKIWFSLNQTNTSTLPPILNAVEIYRVVPLPQQPTYQSDVDAILDVKTKYNLKATGWQGDPCLPVLPWNGLNCTIDDNGSPRITYLNLALMDLSGEILPSLSSLSSLTYLNLSHNALTGTIPDSLAQLTSLRTIDLGGNLLTGAVPNALMDKVKSGFLSLRIEDNPGLCSSESCPNTNNRHKIYALAAVSASVFMVLIGVALFYVYKWKGKAAKTDAGMKSKNRRFTYSEILNMTRNFETMIGRGGFGNVYHGYLTDATTEVAVKILKKPSALSRELFQSEAELLMRVHHKNLVNLVGYCDEGETMALVCDFMTYGDLQKCLSGTTESDTARWKKRLQIAVDVAQGLDYLHSGCKPAIVHRDMKPANILLDDKMQAKITDFGMSKIFASESASHISTDHVVGTQGYVDPEYHVTFRLNEKSDVYSFGVILLELITGRPTIIKSEEEEEEAVHIAKWVTPLLEGGEINTIVDVKFRGDFSINSAWNALETAMTCVLSKGIQRPSMAQVLAELKQCLELEIAHCTANDRGQASLNHTLADIYVHSDATLGPSAR